MIRNAFIIILAITCISTFFLPTAASAREVHMLYAMTSQGFPIGRNKMVRKFVELDGKKLTQDKIVTTIYGEQGEDPHIRATEVAHLEPNGTIYRYDADFEEDGSPVTLKASWVDGQFMVRIRRGADLGLFEVFNREEFDFTTSNMPFSRLKLDKDKTIRKILNMYEPTVRENTMQYLGPDTIEIGDQVFKCETLTFDYELVRGKIWMAKDELGWFLVKEEAKTDDGPFELTLTEYEVK